MSVVFLLIALQLGVDLAWDQVQGDASPLHLIIEAITGATALLLGLRLLRVLKRRSQSITHLKSALQASQEESEHWHSEAAQALQGLGKALDTQFERWSLSQAEREVAMFLLKGFSTRDIAEIRSTSERTVRQQAQDVYRKAALSGRAELSAFFLEDLLLPPSHG
jgi:DNA-binding NarL/FixJ family response regulator